MATRSTDCGGRILPRYSAAVWMYRTLGRCRLSSGHFWYFEARSFGRDKTNRMLQGADTVPVRYCSTMFALKHVCAPTLKAWSSCA